MSRSERLAALLLWLVFTLIWFGSIGQRSLIHPDEGRYAAISLEMLRSGDWVTPRLNGLLYFEKPILQYWAGAAAYAVFGVNEFAARFWPALTGYLAVLITGFTAWRLWGQRAGLHALIACGSITWVVLNSHFLTLDMGLSAYLTLTLCAMLLAVHTRVDGRVQRRWILLAWAGMALATLSKGLVGIVIPGATLVIYSLWQRDWAIWRELQWVRGPIVLLAIAAPWFIAVSLRNPDFAQFFFIHEHFARYTSDVHRREGAWWYFIPVLVVGALPWTSALPWLAAPGRDAHQRVRAMAIAWCALIFVFFSLSGSKLPSYILPMFPAIALLLASRLERTGAQTLRWHLLVPVAFWAGVIGVTFFAAAKVGGDTPEGAIKALAHALQIGAVLFFAAAALAWWLLGRGRVTLGLACVGLAQLIGLLLPLNAHNEYGRLKTADTIAALIERELPRGAPVFAVQNYDQTLPFYLGRNVTLVNYVDEFDFGQQHEPGRWVPTMVQFEQTWRELPQAAAYMELGTYAELKKQNLPMRTIYEDARRVVVVKP